MLFVIDKGKTISNFFVPTSLIDLIDPISAPSTLDFVL